MRTQLHGTESTEVAAAMLALANALDFFNNVDDDEILRLIEQSIAIFVQVEGSSSMNIAIHENKLGNTYVRRAMRAQVANDLDRYVANLQLALTHFREAARIHRANNHVDSADKALHNAANVEEKLRQIGIVRVATTAATTRGSIVFGRWLSLSSIYTALRLSVSVQNRERKVAHLSWPN